MIRCSRATCRVEYNPRQTGSLAQNFTANNSIPPLWQTQSNFQMELIWALISLLGLKRDPVASPLGFNEASHALKVLLLLELGGVNSMASLAQHVPASIAHG